VIARGPECCSMPPRTPAPDAGPGSTLFPPWMEAAKPAAAPVDVGAKDQRHPQRARRPPELETESTCVEPDYLALLRSVSSVLYRRIRDNDGPQNITHPLFCEDTHTEVPAEDRYRVVRPPLLPQSLPMPTMYMLRKLPPPTKPPPSYPVPSVSTVLDFIENIWHRARLTPQALVICLVYVDRLEARSEGALLHARSWRPIIFASLLLASKVWHDISYWNSDFSTICPMFTTRNINLMERAYLNLLQYNTIISASQYASYYFSLRTAAIAIASPQKPEAPSSPGQIARGRDNFRSKYFLTLNVPSAKGLHEKTLAVAGSLERERELREGARRHECRTSSPAAAESSSYGAQLGGGGAGLARVAQTTIDPCLSSLSVSL